MLKGMDQIYRRKYKNDFSDILSNSECSGPNYINFVDSLIKTSKDWTEQTCKAIPSLLNCHGRSHSDIMLELIDYQKKIKI